ncbi:unnamed protein product, partial [Ascophyllum nodosum]
VAKRWSARWEKRSTEAAEVEEGGVYSGRRRPIGGGGDEGENDASLGLFLFLVRVGNFGLPIEPQTAMLRDVRNVLLAHIPASYHREMAFKPAQRIGWGDDSRGGRVGTMAREYQGLVTLEHREAFFRVAYNALRTGRALCYGDLAFALSGTAESVREVNITKLRRIVLHGNGASDQAQEPTTHEAFDVEFTDILSRYLRPIPGTSYYIYWRRKDDEDHDGPSCGPLDRGRPGRVSYLSNRRRNPRPPMTTMLAGDDAFASSGSATTAAPLNDRSPPPLFLRFDCAHEMPPAVTANAAIASANAAPAVTEARKGRADDDDAVSRPPSSSFSPGVGAEVDGDRSTRGG